MLFSLLRRSLTALLLAAGLPAALAQAPRHYPLPTPEKPVSLLAAGPRTYLVTETSVWELSHGQLQRRYQSPAPISCALMLGDTALWLGTRQGLLALGTRTFGARPLPVAAAGAPAAVTTLFRDGAGGLWVGTAGYGLFRAEPGQPLAPALSVPTINAGLVGPDSSVWVGTNLGLYRQQHGTWKRYNEEGVANLEIPDNLVENLLLDNVGNLWVIMSESISVFEAAHHAEADGHGHLPTVRFVGRPGNVVYGVAYLSGQGRLFATAEGLLLLPHEQPAEPLASLPTQTDQIAPQQLLRPVLPPPGAGNPRLLQLAHGRAWLVSETGITVLKEKVLRRYVQVQATAPSGVARQ